MLRLTCNRMQPRGQGRAGEGGGYLLNNTPTPSGSSLDVALVRQFCTKSNRVEEYCVVGVDWIDVGHVGR